MSYTYHTHLAPLAARATEFEALYAELQVKRQVCTALNNMIKVTRRMIRAKIAMASESALRGPWSALQDEYATLIQRLPTRKTASDKLQEILDWFKALKARVDEAFVTAVAQPEESDVQPDPQRADVDADTDPNSSNRTLTQTKNDIHSPTTPESQGVKRNGDENKRATGGVPESQTGEPAEKAENVNMDIEWGAERTRRTDIDVPTLMAACPRFARDAHGLQGYLRDWNDVYRAAERLRSMIGITDEAWHVATRILGHAVAAVAVALICDKYEGGEIRSPGGYLRGIVERARSGELHLDRSIFGRLSKIRDAEVG